jgi:hypothetical protein
MWEQHEYIHRHPNNFVEAMTENWTDKTECLIAFEKRQKSRTIRVRYEDLVSGPNETLAPVAAFLSLEWPDSIPSNALTLPHFGGGGDYKIKTESAIHTKSLGGGHRLPIAQLSPPLIARVNHCHEALKYDLLPGR